MIFSLTISLLLTIIIETCTSLMMGIKNKDDLIVIFWANVLTNPVVVFTANMAQLTESAIFGKVVICILEISVIIVEYIVFKKFLEYSKKKLLYLAIVNNVLSYSIGVIITELSF